MRFGLRRAAAQLQHVALQFLQRLLDRFLVLDDQLVLFDDLVESRIAFRRGGGLGAGPIQSADQ